MADIDKYKDGEVAAHLGHNLRELPEGKESSNVSIVKDLSCNNYSLIDRCSTVEEATAYRKEIEKECFKYNRSNIVHAVEVVLQCPSDCPESQKADFFRESYNYICSTLPMGERCVFSAQVHVDERHYTKSGEMISKDHLHVMYVPAVPDTKHPEYEYKLCADQLTRYGKLKRFHPGLQKHLDDAGIQATVYTPKDGKIVPFTVDQLKELTAKTGIHLKHSVTVDELATIINEHKVEFSKVQAYSKELESKLQEAEKKIIELQRSKEASWGQPDPSWGSLSDWGSIQKDKTIDKEHIV